jgi:hypothetical protein
MAQRHSNDKLQAECTRLHACASAAMASATKHRQLAASFGLGSPASVKKSLFSASGTMRSADKRPRERHSSTGTASTYTSTQVHEDEEEGGQGSGEEDADSGTEVDENESRSNTPVASPASSPSVDKQSAKLTASQGVLRQTNTALDEDYWTTQI